MKYLNMEVAESINISMCKASKEKERKGGSQNALEIIFLEKLLCQRESRV